MKKKLSGTQLLGIAALLYGLAYLVDGIIGDIFGFVGLICLALGFVNFIMEIVKHFKNKKQE